MKNSSHFQNDHNSREEIENEICKVWNTYIVVQEIKCGEIDECHE